MFAQQLLTTTRPARWPLLVGAYVIGLFLSGIHPAILLHPTVAIFALYFTFPAHVLLFSLQEKTTTMFGIAFLSTLPFLILAFSLDAVATLFFLLFVASTVVRRAESLRLSVRYIAFGAAYFFTALFAFFLIGGKLF